MYVLCGVVGGRGSIYPSRLVGKWGERKRYNVLEVNKQIWEE